MMKARFSAWVFFAGLLCFVPCALGQGSVSAKVAHVGSSVLNYAPPSFLILNSGVGRLDPDHKDSNGCSNQGRDSRGWSGSSPCRSVPEGGTTFMYLLLAGVFCLGAIALGSRRRGLRAKQTS
jgi:hypothetical protein